MLDRIADHTLDNGLKVICLRKPGAPLVAVQVWYRTGSVNEYAGIRGTSHILEHMMFRGSNRLGPQEHARRVNNVGGHSNAGTAEDVTLYFNTVPSDFLTEIVEMEADRMNGLTLDEGEFEKERRVVVEEYETYMNNPMTKAMFEFRKEFFGDDPYAVSQLGVLEDIQSVTCEQCREYYRKWYTPDNAVVVAVGDFEDEGALFSLVGRSFGSIPRSPERIGGGGADGAAVSLRDKPLWMRRRVAFDVPILMMGYRAPCSSHEDAVPLEILQSAFAQGESSRLHRSLVRRQSMVLSAGGMNHFLRRSGISFFFTVFTPDKKPRRIGAALNELVETVRNEGISSEELEKVRNTSLTSRTFGLYSAEQIAQSIGFAETVEGDYHLWARRLRRIETLTPAEVREAARRYWRPEGAHTLVLTPKRVNPLLYLVGLFRRVSSRF